MLATVLEDNSGNDKNKIVVAAVTEENLANLDRRLWDRACDKNQDDDAKSVRSISAYTATSCLTSRSKRQPSIEKPPSVIKSVPYTPIVSARGSSRASARAAGKIDNFGDLAYTASQPLPKDETPKPTFDWSTLDRVAARMHEKDLEQQKVHERELQFRLQEDLKKQIADFHLKGKREREYDRQHFGSQVESLTNWQAQEEREKRRAREKALIVEKHLNLQVQTGRLKKEEDERLARLEAEEVVTRMRQENELDRQETEQRRHLRRELMQQALDEGMTAKQKRDDELRARTAAEDSSIEAYRQQVTSRVQASQDDRWQRVTPSRQKVESEVSSRLVAERKKIELDCLKADQEIAEKNAKAEAALKEQKEKVKKERLETQQYVLKQIELKKEGQQKEQQLKRYLGSALERDAKKFVETENSRTVSQRERALEHRTELEKQIAAKMCSPKKIDCMSASEAAMNRRLLERISKFETEEASVFSPRI
jgi:hypothetical protein|mmetsp:Transcript_29653/g.47760  ORF Transcript_29653/g.47760 Transcript_29653/m.47760 type:complete len:483 (-) Transcript_29653:22-1470(-)